MLCLEEQLVPSLPVGLSLSLFLEGDGAGFTNKAIVLPLSYKAR